MTQAGSSTNGAASHWNSNGRRASCSTCYAMAGRVVWFLNGEAVRALGPEHAVTEGGRVFDRVTRAEWVNSYQKRTHDGRV
jgi:hypothetical protein